LPVIYTTQASIRPLPNQRPVDLPDIYGNGAPWAAQPRFVTVAVIRPVPPKALDSTWYTIQDNGYWHQSPPPRPLPVRHTDFALVRPRAERPAEAPDLWSNAYHAALPQLRRPIPGDYPALPRRLDNRWPAADPDWRPWLRGPSFDFGKTAVPPSRQPDQWFEQRPDMTSWSAVPRLLPVYLVGNPPLRRLEPRPVETADIWGTQWHAIPVRIRPPDVTPPPTRQFDPRWYATDQDWTAWTGGARLPAALTTRVSFRQPDLRPVFDDSMPLVFWQQPPKRSRPPDVTPPPLRAIEGQRWHYITEPQPHWPVPRNLYLILTLQPPPTRQPDRTWWPPPEPTTCWFVIPQYHAAFAPPGATPSQFVGTPVAVLHSRGG
jgi:hypothetical protein